MITDIVLGILWTLACGIALYLLVDIFRWVSAYRRYPFAYRWSDVVLAMARFWVWIISVWGLLTLILYVFIVTSWGG